MKRHSLIAASALASGLLMASTVVVGQRVDRCDRACLEGLLDRYVEALVAHDPSRLPLASGVKFTENGQRLALGDGAWNTVTGTGAYRLPIADVETGQAVLMGTVREADTPTVFVLRLKVVDRRITEVETLVIRNQMAAESLDRIGRPRRSIVEALPESARASRDELVRIANMYFSGIELNDGKGVYPIHESCARLENGAVTAGDPAAVLGDAAPATGGGGARE